MKIFVRTKRVFAATMLLVMTAELLVPAAALALTSGPVQPEMQGFKPIGDSDMVDLFTGDFSYNIPLMDVGGYPLNLAYHSGSNLDDESSWVGYGWSLNPGAVNRQLRGVPDDFNGSDQVSREKSMKDHIVYGAKVSGTLDLLGVPVKSFKGNNKRTKNLKLKAPTLSLAVKVDNYRGIGVDLGMDIGLQLTESAAEPDNSTQGSKTNVASNNTTARDANGNNKPKNDLRSLSQLSAGLTLSAFDGASLEAGFSTMSKKKDNDDRNTNISIGFPYNSRRGLSSMTLSVSHQQPKLDGEKLKFLSMGQSSAMSFNTDPFYLNIDMPRRSFQGTFSFHPGAELFVIFPSLGLSGFFSKQWYSTNKRALPAYGTLYAHAGKNVANAVMDFNREKDIPYTPEVPFLPLPVATPDLFSVTSQSGGGQYRLYNSSSVSFFDPETKSNSTSISAGIEVGAGQIWDVGADLYFQTINSGVRKWTRSNDFLPNQDLQLKGSSALYEPMYFKRVGEPVPLDQPFSSSMGQLEPVAATLSRYTESRLDGARADNRLRSKSNPRGAEVAAPIQRQQRDVRNNVLSYLNSSEAARFGLNKTIDDHQPLRLSLNNCDPGLIRNRFQRTGGFRKKHHISEITVTADDGRRSVYGIPVYNVMQEDVSFAVAPDASARNQGLIGYVPGTDDAVRKNTKGIDNYVSREQTPAYATGYLLTGILSPEYRDLTGNGISDDDHGDAVKFNYTRLDGLYKWRTPYAQTPDMANYNEGLLSDPNDDKANYSYGEKEVWYMHSVESKTMVAYFVTSDRDDGLGVTNNRGAKETNLRMKKLDQIRLYSKAEVKAANGNLSQVTPIKVAHFEYDYSLINGLPNHVNNGGKLTLRKVWFTYGLNNRGRLHPYQFDYDMAANNTYQYRQYDRWGVFKDPAVNPGGMNNAEYPYTHQAEGNPRHTDGFVSAGQLISIKLPSGGQIQVHYESDDYAFVQDKRAGIMAQVAGVFNATNQTVGTTGLINARELVINLPSPQTEDVIRKKCFQGMDKLYFKCLMDLDNLNHQEYVPGYALIQSITPMQPVGGGKFAQVRVQLQMNNQVNPIAAAAWQFLRIELPQYAYPGSMNLQDPGTGFQKAIKALASSVKSISELFNGFERRAKRLKYGDKLVPERSWVRIGVPERKLGGGSRVKKIEITDNWASQSGTPGAQTTKLTQLYQYTTKDVDGSTISSGVASYEPGLGGDENPFREPVPYQEKQFLGLNTFRYIELPVGESFFPAPSVGYRRVSVRNVGAGDAESVNRTGSVVSEFFTAMDFPTKVSWVNMEKRKPNGRRLLSLLGLQITDILGLTQGYSIEVNDMHGKSRRTTVLNASGDMISGVEYFYKTENNKSSQSSLSNKVQVISASNVVSDGVIGLDVEMFHDSRDVYTNNLGTSAKWSGGMGSLLFIPLPFGFPGVSPNFEKRSYRAISTVKLVQRFGILEKVKKTENGSSITTTNLLWDGLTGNVLLTSTQNEFDDPVYSFNYPAHWEYPGMGAAYVNVGTILESVTTGTNGVISSTGITYMLFPGDELINLQSNARYWVIRTRTSTSATVSTRLIDETGATVTLTGATLKVLRPGRRNLANTSIGTLVSLKSPIVNNAISIAQLTRVLDTKAFTYTEDWSMPVNNYPQTTTQFGCFDRNCMELFMWSAFVKRSILNAPTGQLLANFFALPVNNFSAGIIMDQANTYNESVTYPPGYETCRNQFFPLPPSDPNTFNYSLNSRRFSGNRPTIANGDAGVMGTCTFSFSNVNSTAFTRFASTVPAPTMDELRGQMGARLVQVPNSTPGRCVFDFVVKRTVVLPNCGGIKQPACPVGNDTTLFRITFNCPARQVTDPCASPLNRTINPYVAGILGNWRMQQSYAFQENRLNPRPVTTDANSTDIRNGGAYAQVVPFWSYNATNGWVPVASSELRWIASNEMTLFNNKGLELENRDALNRFSAAQFGYLESIPVAVGSNVMNRELGYDGFEDIGFTLDCNPILCPIPHHLGIRSLINNNSIVLDQTNVHSGKYSLRVNAPISLTRSLATVDANGLVVRTPNSVFDAGGSYMLNSNELVKGFSPLPNKRYIISFWVRDNSPTQNRVNLELRVNGTTIFNNVNTVPVVEKWKRVEAQFTTSGSGNQVIEIVNTGGQYFLDDIRVHPFDAQMKSFAYDPATTRLMAELDENNFATFYEYDDEGILIRVKKETEKGIMTVRETRSSMKKTMP